MNKSWILPVEYKVLILPDKPEETEGGIFIPEAIRDKEELAEVEAELIEIGAQAFEDWDVKPKVGAFVHFAKYAGIYVEGDDGLNYRIINDKDILAIRVRS